MEWEAVIGLEVHAQLLTDSKLFCACSTRFGAPPNSQTCPVCLGLPGALPVLNREAVEMAVKAGLALGCTISPVSIFARKNYFYPDLPKGYQISQYDQPLAEGGRVQVLTHKSSQPGAETCLAHFGITRVHLEDDAGKSTHTAGQDTLVNLNRTGVPLIEIVTEPDLRAAQQAYDFLTLLRRVLLYLEICDGNMEEGSLRCDANVSVRPAGSTQLGVKTEIKNLNSFRFLRRALEYEIERQVDVLSEGGEIHQETRSWNEERQQTLVMRSKEYAHDYRYFPDPDLTPLEVGEEWVERLRGQLPELPEPRRQRLASQYQLGDDEAALLTQSREFADYFEQAADRASSARAVYNWMVGDLTRFLKKDSRPLVECPVSPEHLAELVDLVETGRISGKIAKDVFEKVYVSGDDPATIVAREGLEQISDQAQLGPLIDGILESHPAEVKAYRGGKTGLLGFFVGQVMRQTRGQADPKAVNQMLREKLQADE